MTSKAAIVSVLLAAAPLAQAAEPSAKEEVIPATQVPAAARQTLEAKAGKNRIHRFTQRTEANGAVSYDVRYHTLTTGDTEVQVTPAGQIVGVYRKLEEPVGSGP